MIYNLHGRARRYGREISGLHKLPKSRRTVSCQKHSGRIDRKRIQGFFDEESLRSGDFNISLLDKIEECEDFVLVLTPGDLDRCSEPKDWVRREFVHALNHKKNIVPILTKGFDWPSSLPKDMQNLPKQNGLFAIIEFFDEVIDRLVKSFLHSVPQNSEATDKQHITAAETGIIEVEQMEKEEEEPIRPYKGEKSYLFISYSHRDAELVYPIIRHMQGLGLRVWFDEGIVPGKEWDDYVAERVLECDAMIAFISPNYLKSSNCRDELNYARDVEKERLLIYLENVKLTPGMAMRMNRIQAIHQYAYSKQSLFYEKLMECYFVARNRSFDGE